MTRFVIIVTLLFTATYTSGQAFVVPTLTPKVASALLKTLNKKIEDTIRIDILLQLAHYYLRKEGNEKSDLDSAGLLVRNAKEINSKLLLGKRDGLVSLFECSLEIRAGNPVAGRELANKAIRLFQSSNDDLHLAQSYLALSRCYDSKVPDQASAIKKTFNSLFQRVPGFINSEQRDRYALELISFYCLKMRDDIPLIKLDYLNHLARFYKTIDQKLEEFWARKESCDVNHQQGKTNEAIIQLLEIAKEQKDGGYDRICFTYDLLSGLYLSIGKYDTALHFSLETIKNVRTRQDSMALSPFYERVAAIYSETGSMTEAVEWNLKRVNYLVAIKQTHYIYGTIHNIIADLIKLGRSRDALALIISKSKSVPPANNAEKRAMLISLAKSYAALNENAMAEKYSEELIKIIALRIKRNEISRDPQADEFLASFYLNIGQYDKAEKHFKGALDVRWNPKGDQFTHNFLFKLDSARGNYLSAIKHLQAWQKDNDSTFTATTSRQIEELKISYATEQKDSLIKLNEDNIQLLTKQDQLQKSKLQQGAILRNISFAVAALLIIIVVLFYNRYRLKQRTNKKLESQQLEITDQNLSLQHLVNEKEWLLKEIHHRVKNNLQIVMSLLNSQSIYIDNAAALTAIHDSQHRVHAISLIHQKLYNSENVSSIHMSFYIRELVSYLSDSFDTGQRIRFELNVEPLEMDVSQAVPLGLILNEAITNSIKYAFTADRNGVISISLSNTAPDQYLLSISDNGVGMPSELTNKKSDSLGMNLMAGLSEDLDGSFSIENNNGTTIKISFVYDPGVKRPHALAPSFVSNN